MKLSAVGTFHARTTRVLGRFTAAAVMLAVAACSSGPEAPRLTPPRAFTVFFALNSAELTQDAQNILDRVAQEARNMQATGVGIVGYTSPSGTTADNLRLSEQRAGAVEAGLLARGVPRDIVVRVAQGPTQVIGPEIEGQRVEIVVSREDKPPAK